MCGIAGLVYADRNRPCERGDCRCDAGCDAVSRAGRLRHSTLDSNGRPRAFRRLSIIDLGRRPPADANEDGTFWIVFNGEIYNYRELRASSSPNGHRFRTHCDTEVILQLYEERGEDCVDALNGMFAFAIWDARAAAAARSRATASGIKPLYYAETPERLGFASEIKALLASRRVRAQPRPGRARRVPDLPAGPRRRTLFRGVASCRPAHADLCTDGEHGSTRYWSPADRPTESPTDGGGSQELRGLLDDAVRLQLISDVPVGTFLQRRRRLQPGRRRWRRSSRANASTRSRSASTSPISTRAAYAAMVSKHYGTNHHELRVGNDEFSELFPRMVWHNDEPLDFANSVQIFALSRLAQADVTVVLTGEGSDELFAGYPRYRIPQLGTGAVRVPTCRCGSQ